MSVIRSVFGNTKILGIAFWLLLLAALIYTIRRNYIGAENLKKYGVTVRAIVYEKQCVRGTYNFGIKFLYDKTYFYNHCRSSKLNSAVGDSITIEIDSKNPSAYCEMVP